MLHEEEYFARLELEQRKRLEEERIRSFVEAEKLRLRELHYMRCPKCGMELSDVDYKGIRIDKCLQCEGIWLDAGELDAISKLEKTTFDKLLSVFKQ